MRIGFFTEVYRPVVNGVVASVDGLAQGLRALGHEVFCFAPKVPGYPEADGPVFRMPSLPLPTAAPYRITLPLVSRKNRHDVLQRLDILHAHSPFITGWMSARYARRLRIPLVYTYHTRLEEYAHYVPFAPKLTRRAASSITRRFANLADAVIVPTPSMRDRLLELGVNVPIEIVPSGIDLRQFSSGIRSDRTRLELGARPGERQLLFVGRLAREKNVDLLLEALAIARVPSRLTLIGDGPERDAFEQRAKELHLDDRVRFLGTVPRERLADFYASSDAFVFPSVTETQGMVLAEALAAGLAVIAADAQPARDVLGEAGSAVPPNARAFAEAIDAVPAVPEQDASERARAAAARFGIEEQAGRVAALYESLTRTYVRSMIHA